MEPPSPIQALGVNPFPSRFINRRLDSWYQQEPMKFDGLLVPGILDVGNRDVVWTWDL